MSWLSRVLHRDDHQEWLTKHPGKGEFHLPSTVEADLVDQKRTRDRMERELEEDSSRTQARNASESEVAGRKG